MTRPGTDQRAQWVAIAVSSAMMAQVVAGKATRDALFLQAFSVKTLPAILVVGAVVSFALAELSSSLLVRFGPHKVVPRLFLANALGFGAESVLWHRAPQGVALTLYVHVVAAGAVLTSGFWSVVSERFDPHSIKRHAGRIAAGGSLGGVLGGLVGWGLSRGGDPLPILAVLGGLNLAAAVGLSGLGGAHRQGQAPVDPDTHPPPLSRPPLRQVFAVPYLRHLALVVVIGAAMQALLDYALSAHAVAHFGRGQSLAAFFCWFYIANNALGLLGQLGVGEAVLARFGLVGAVGSVPAIVGIGSLFGAIFPGITSSVAVRSAEFVTRGAVFRPGYEILFAPLPHAQRRRTKAIIDVGADRLGTALGSGVTALLIALVGARIEQSVMLSVCLFSLVSLWLCAKLGPGHAAAIEAGLRAGTLTPGDGEFAERLSLTTIGATAVEIDRNRLLAALAALQAPAQQPSSRPSEPPRVISGAATPDPGTALGSPHPWLAADGAPPTLRGAGSWMVSEESEPIGPPSSDAELLSLVLELGGGDRARKRAILSRGTSLDPRCAPWLIALLEDDGVAVEAAAALSRMMPAITGQLVDALLDPTRPAVLRRRIPRLIVQAPRPRAILALTMALDCDSFGVQFASARALFNVTAGQPPMLAFSGAIWEAVRRELGRHAPASALRKRRQYLYALMGSVVDREPLAMALNALGGTDSHLRGTAIEYLSGALPEDVLASYLALVGVEYFGGR